jgi:hypothetical protein
MIEISASAQQPPRQPWPMDRLVYERSILLGMAIDNSTAATYSSALNSYPTFCKLHSLPVEPTPETLSFYITFQSSHINPKSVKSYLSGISNNLKPFFPNVRANRASALVKKTMSGALRRHGTPTKRKSPLTTAQLQLITMQFAASNDHNDKLFITMLNTGYTGLLRLAEMTMHDNPNLHNFKKVTLHNSIHWLDSDFDFFLPTHKSNAAFEGNQVYIKQILNAPNPSPLMQRYLESRDSRFPLHPHLWLTSHGIVPTRRWFISRLQKHCPPDIAGQSLRAGGATAMAEAGSPGPLIQGTGRWSSTTFQTYIRRNPIVLHALIMGRTLHYTRAVTVS